MLRQISTAAFVRLMFFKDMRALRYPLILLLALSLAFVLLPLNPYGTENWDLAAALQCVLFLGLGVFLLTIPVIQSDPAGREFRFLLTRPVPGSAIGLAKALFLAAFVIVPYWLSLEFVIACSHVPLTALDHLLLLMETLVSCGVGLASLVLWCVFLRNRLLVVVIVVLSMFVPSILTAWWHELNYQRGVLPPWPSLEHERLSHFCALLGNAVFLGVALVAIGWRYGTKSYRGPLILALGGYALSLLVLFWPYNWAQGLEDQSSNRSVLTPEQLGRIHMNLITQKGHQPPYNLAGGDWNGGYIVNLNQSVQFDGIEPPYFVQTVGYHAVITLRSGKTITSDYANFPAHGGVGGLNPSFMAVVAGVRPSWPYQRDQQLDLLTYLPKDLGNEDITGATIKGVITLEVRRAYVAGSIPMQPHVSFIAPRRRYEITQPEFLNDSLSISLNFFQFPLILRGDVVNWTSPDDLQWLAVYRPFDEALKQMQSSFNGGGSNFGINIAHRDYTYKPPDHDLTPGWRPLPPDWASGAELVFIGSDPCGQVKLPYEIDNVDLSH